MARYISKLFQPEKPNEQPKLKRPPAQYDNKKLPPDFAEQILIHDIILDLSEYSSQESLHALVQLYMKGVEYYESLQDERQLYFKKKLQWLMSHPKILQQNQEKSKQSIMRNQPVPAPQPYVKPQQHAIEQSTYYQSHMPTIQSVMKDDESVCQIPDDYELRKQISDSKVIVVENDNNKEEYVEQTLKAERYRLDEKRQAREMLDGARRDSIKVTEIFKHDIESQLKNLDSRLRQRSTRKYTMNRASSQPVFQRMTFGLDRDKGMDTMVMDTEGDDGHVIKEIREDRYESSQAVSRRPSNPNNELQ